MGGTGRFSKKQVLGSIFRHSQLLPEENLRPPVL